MCCSIRRGMAGSLDSAALLHVIATILQELNFGQDLKDNSDISSRFLENIQRFYFEHIIFSIKILT